MTVARIAAAFPVALTLIPLARTGWGSVRMWDFPRLQVAALGVSMLAALRTLGRKSWVDDALSAALAASVLYQISKVLPYTPLYPKQMRAASGNNPKRRLRLFMGNVYQYNDHFEQVLAAVHRNDPDLICLVETDSRWDRALKALQDRYPWSQRCPIGNTYGMVLYSRLPLESVETRFLVERGIPSMRAVVRLRSGEPVTVYCVHPRPPMPGSPSYGRDAELVLVGCEVADRNEPAMVLGDLNDVAWSYTTKLFQRVSHTVDPRVGRGLYNSFHADLPWLRYPLDHIFVTRHFALVRLERLDHVGSDHFPILAEIEYAPEEAWKQEVPVADEEEREQAAEMLHDVEEHADQIDQIDRIATATAERRLLKETS